MESMADDQVKMGMSSSTDNDTEKDEHETQAREDPDRSDKIQAAYASGHDADIPSSTGYVLDEQGELKRQRSIADQASLAKSRSHGSHVTTTDLEKGSLPKDTKVTDHDPNIVWWDGENDPENPYNWPRWRRVTICVLISLLTFVTPLASSIFAPGVPQLMEDFRSDSQELAAFVVSVYVLGFAFGPLFIAPLSEIYGRTVVYHACNVGFVAFLIACAVAPTLNTLIVFRFFSGVFGSCPLTNGGGSISDMIRQEKRAVAMSAFSIGPLLGPIIGPVAGGFLAAAKGWRWVFWVLAIIAGFVAVLMVVLLRETYAPVVLQRKVNRLRKETGKPLLRSKLDVGLSPADFFKRSIVRPMKMLTRSPITAIFALYMAVVSSSSAHRLSLDQSQCADHNMITGIWLPLSHVHQHHRGVSGVLQFQHTNSRACLSRPRNWINDRSGCILRHIRQASQKDVGEGRSRHEA